MELEVWNVLGTWFSGVATLGAVGYAFYLQRKFSERTKPKLRLKLDQHRYLPPAFIRSEPYDPNREEVWFRVEVLNEGAVPANDVELRLVALEEGTTDLQSPKWWFKVANLDSVSMETLHPRFSHYFDLVFLVHAFGSSPSRRAFLVISKNQILPWAQAKPEIESSEYCELDANREYRLRLALTSANAPAKYYSVEFRISPTNSVLRAPNGVVGKDELLKSVRISNPCEDT